MKARKGDPIVCSCGTVAGTLQSDILDGAPITTDTLGGLTYDGVSDGNYRCEKCHQSVAVSLCEGVWRIHTSHGWVE